MKTLPQHLQDKLIDYLDGTLDRAQREALEQMLREDEMMQKRLEELRSADQVLRTLSAEQPSQNFTQRVMTGLEQSPARTGVSIRNGLLLLTGVVVVMAIAAVLVSAGIFDETATFDLNNIGIAQRYIKQTLPSIPVDGKLMVNTIILLNLALAFLVLDRAVLKPLFRKRMQADA